MATAAGAYDWEGDLRHRLLCDFTADRESVVDYIRGLIPGVTDEKITAWERSGALECMELDGEKRYFHAAARNLFLSEKRADIVESELIKRGVDAARISKSFKGDKENPFPTPEENRVTVCFVK